MCILVVFRPTFGLMRPHEALKISSNPLGLPKIQQFFLMGQGFKMSLHYTASAILLSITPTPLTQLSQPWTASDRSIRAVSSTGVVLHTAIKAYLFIVDPDFPHDLPRLKLGLC